MNPVDIVAAICLLGGCVLAVLAGIGFWRFPDVLSRMHAATKPAVLGVLLVVVGAALRMGAPGNAALLLLVGVFQLLTAPVAAHMVGRAAYRAEAVRTDRYVRDELADAVARERLQQEREYPEQD